jgi:signal peptidase I
MDENIMIKRRKWWLAGLFSYLVPGLGQVYNGQATKGLFFNFLLTTWVSLFLGLIYNIMKHPISGFSVAVLFLLLFITLGIFLLIIFESIRIAWKSGEGHALKPYNKWFIYLIVILVVSGVNYLFEPALANIIRDHIVKAYKIPAESMHPTIKRGDYLLSSQLYYRYNSQARGDVIIFKNPRDENQDFIKRIIGCPGDTIEIKDNQVFLNGKKSDEPYAFYTKGEPLNNFGPFLVPENEYFVLGDNRDNSLDSRAFGGIKRHTIEGKIMFIYFSWDMNAPAWNIIGRLLSIRLSRIGEIIR